MMRSNGAFAQQIVDSAKAVVGWNINFIDSRGIIIASTDAGRIGKYHEAGYEAARLRRALTVPSSTAYKGSCEGVNYPIIMNDEVVGVIGITGRPAVVSKYGFLLTKICELFLKEYWLDTRSQSEMQRRSQLVQALLYRDRKRAERLGFDRLDASERYEVVVFVFRREGQERFHCESALADEMRRLGFTLCAEIYPSELVCLVPQSRHDAYRRHAESWQALYEGQFWLGAGLPQALEDAALSYRFAKLAVARGQAVGLPCVWAETMDLGLLLESVDETARRQYAARIVGNLSDGDAELLRVYFRRNLSLQETAAALSIHKNTLQYRLRKIQNQTGLDPRKFMEAVSLYIALHLS